MNSITVLDIIILILTLYFVIRGYNRGFLKQTSAIIGVILALIIAMQYCLDLQPYVAEYVNASENMLQFISFAVLFITVNIFIHVLGMVIKNILDMLFLKPLDHIAGAVLGMIKAFIIVYLLVLLISQIPYEPLIEQVANSAVASKLLEMTPLIQDNLQNIFGP